MRTDTGNTGTNLPQPLPLLKAPDHFQHTADVQMCFLGPNNLVPLRVLCPIMVTASPPCAMGRAAAELNMGRATRAWGHSWEDPADGGVFAGGKSCTAAGALVLRWTTRIPTCTVGHGSSYKTHSSLFAVKIDMAFGWV